MANSHEKCLLCPKTGSRTKSLSHPKYSVFECSDCGKYAFTSPSGNWLRQLNPPTEVITEIQKANQGDKIALYAFKNERSQFDDSWYIQNEDNFYIIEILKTK